MITGLTASRIDTTTVVTAVSSLSGAVYYFWYVDGAHVGMSAAPQKTFVLQDGDQAQVAVIDSNDPNFDPVANNPGGYAGTRTIEFQRSLDPSIAKYRIDQRKNAAAWLTMAYIQDDPTTWDYQWTSQRLDDLNSYAWRIVPIDQAGNAGTLIDIGAPVRGFAGGVLGEFIVRVPDAPAFALAFDAGTTKVTFSAA